MIRVFLKTLCYTLFALQGFGFLTLYSQTSSSLTETVESLEPIDASEIEDVFTPPPANESETLPPSYVIEIEVGVNFFGYDTNQTTARYNLDNISDPTALSYNLKTGIVFLNRWKSLLAFGYSKRPNFEYPLHNIQLNQSTLENHRYFRLGFEQQYFLADYRRKLNFAVGLENSWLQRSVRITDRTIENGIRTGLSAPRTFTWNEYLLSPKIKFLYRISRYSLLHFSVEYHTLFPSLEHYPQILFGIDISFFLYKPKEQTAPPLEEALPKIPENIREGTQEAIEEKFSN